VAESELAYNGGSPADISGDWVKGTDILTLEKVGLPQGWYALVMRLFEKGAINCSAGFATLARVVKDQTTSGVIELAPNPVGGGGFQILIDMDFYDPLILSTTIPEGDIAVMTTDSPVVIEVTNADIYGWWLNGVAQTSEATFTVDPADYLVGQNYRLDVIGWSGDGKHAGMLSYNIIRSYNPEELQASGRINYSGWGNYNFPCVVQAVSEDAAIVYVSESFTGDGVVPFVLSGLPADTNFCIRMSFNGGWDVPASTGHKRYWATGDLGTNQLSSATVLHAPPAVTGINFDKVTQ